MSEAKDDLRDLERLAVELAQLAFYDGDYPKLDCL